MPAGASGRERGGGPREGEAGAGSWPAAKATACPSRLTPSCLLVPWQQARGYLPGGRETHLEDMTGPRRKPQRPRGPMTQERLCRVHGPHAALEHPLPLGLRVPIPRGGQSPGQALSLRASVPSASRPRGASVWEASS